MSGGSSAGTGRAPRVSVGVRIAGFAKEREIPEPEHVNAGEQGGEDADEPQELAERTVLKCLVQNGVLGEEGCQWRESGYGKDRCAHRPEGNGNFLAQATHFAHILLAAECVNHGACGEEEERFEESMRHQVEDGR